MCFKLTFIYLFFHELYSSHFPRDLLILGKKNDLQFTERIINIKWGGIHVNIGQQLEQLDTNKHKEKHLKTPKKSLT